MPTSNLVKRGGSFSIAIAVVLWLSAVFNLFLTLMRALFHGSGGFFGKLQDGLLGHAFGEAKESDSFAPLLVLIIFGAVVLQVPRIALRIYREQQVLPLVRQAADPLPLIANHTGAFRGTRRAGVLSSMASRSTDELEESISTTAALDAEALGHAYSVLKVYTWTLPVVGFIGTAAGMADAINGFKAALDKGGADLPGFTSALSQTVIPGLANAFSVTMLALGTSVAAHFWLVSLETWDQEVLNELDEICAEKLRARGPRSNDRMGLHEVLMSFKTMMERLTELVDTLDELKSAGVGTPDWVDAVRAVADAAAANKSAASELKTAAAELRATTNAPYSIVVRRG